MPCLAFCCLQCVQRTTPRGGTHRASAVRRNARRPARCAPALGRTHAVSLLRHLLHVRSRSVDLNIVSGLLRSIGRMA